MLRTATRAELVEHTRDSIKRTPGVSPAGLAPAAIEHRHGRLVGVQHPAGEHEAPVRLPQRLLAPRRCVPITAPVSSAAFARPIGR